MAVVCHNCKSADTASGGGEVINCLNCGAKLDQNGDAIQPGVGDFPITLPEGDAPKKKGK